MHERLGAWSLDMCSCDRERLRMADGNAVLQPAGSPCKLWLVRFITDRQPVWNLSFLIIDTVHVQCPCVPLPSGMRRWHQ